MRDNFSDELHEHSDELHEHLNEWEQQILNVVDTYEDRVSQQSIISMSQYDLNCNELIQVRMPQSYDHSLLAAVLAVKYEKSLLIYTDTDHLISLDSKVDSLLKGEEQKFNKISMFEIYYAIIESNKNSIYLDRIRDKLINSKIIIVDNASKVPEMVKDFILSIATSQVVFLN
ncbi:MAG: hypothetical protein WDA06_00445 [Phenylobacterium sp.]